MENVLVVLILAYCALQAMRDPVPSHAYLLGCMGVMYAILTYP